MYVMAIWETAGPQQYRTDMMLHSISHRSVTLEVIIEQQSATLIAASMVRKKKKKNISTNISNEHIHVTIPERFKSWV